jgi:hypothetical protein
VNHQSLEYYDADGGFYCSNTNDPRSTAEEAPDAHQSRIAGPVGQARTRACTDQGKHDTARDNLTTCYSSSATSIDMQDRARRQSIKNEKRDGLHAWK